MKYYYINGREQKENDNVRCNYSVHEQYTEEGKIIINPQQIKWKQVDTLPAFYLYAFSNGKYYAGSTNNALKRLTQHYNNWNNKNIKDWHKEIGDLIRSKTNGKSFKYNFVAVIKIFIQYTSTVMVAEQIEKQWLQNVAAAAMQQAYYNTILFNGKQNKQQISPEKKLNKELTNESSNVINFDTINEKQLIIPPINSELNQIIDEKLTKLANIGNIHIRFPDKEELIFNSIQPKEHLRRILHQLMNKDNKTFATKDLKRKREEHGKPFQLNELWICIDGDRTFEIQQNNRKQMRDMLSTIPSYAGIYILTFPNQKKYIGSSINIQRRIKEHFNELFFSTNPTLQWYKDCRMEFYKKLTPADIKIDYYQTNNRKEAEKYEIKKAIEVGIQIYNTKKEGLKNWNF